MTSTDPHADEPTTGSVALIDQTDTLLDGLAEIEKTIASEIPPGLWKASTKYDRRHLLVPYDLPDLQIDCWDVQSAHALANQLPWTGAREFVQKGRGHDLYTWAGHLSDFQVWVIGPQELPSAAPRWWSKVECNEAPEGGDPS